MYGCCCFSRALLSRTSNPPPPTSNEPVVDPKLLLCLRAAPIAADTDTDTGDDTAGWAFCARNSAARFSIRARVLSRLSMAAASARSFRLSRPCLEYVIAFRRALHQLIACRCELERNVCLRPHLVSKCHNWCTATRVSLRIDGDFHTLLEPPVFPPTSASATIFERLFLSLCCFVIVGLLAVLSRV